MTKYFYPALALVLCLGTNQLRAQFCTTDARYTATPVFTSSQISTADRLLYATAENRDGDQQDLFLDLYFPDPTVDTASTRPLVLLIHGGGFRDGDRQNLAFECEEFARRGFVAATIDYRTGFNRQNPLDYLRAIYRAEQDALAALRYLGSRTDAYGIDPDWAFIGGVSAGSISALNAVYVDETDWNAIVPGITLRLGPLKSTGNSLPERLQLRGVFNNWGSTLPTAITTDELLPTIAFHGAADETVPIDTSDLGLIGSRPIHALLLDAGVCSDLTVDPFGRHGIYRDTLGTQARIAKASCFFKRLFCASCESVTATELIPAACANLVSTRPDPLMDPIQVYPNPTSGFLSLSGLLPGTEVEVYDATGRRIFRGLRPPADLLIMEPAGVYLFRFIRDGRSRVVRVVRR
ncbi:carboxylesterase family protein [Lewinella sp. 4G2]|uniref:carboxylesterase family protein n=1 Tax=Lewinella sp. 4G2 TaxID=1803372 RepID=UPI0007B4A088|nr:carboxylesterase family protein [Lewinella sp. 4G2]OAV43714.1 hypothetical protein A3850_004015 [Lewinella sp. 4G2]